MATIPNGLTVASRLLIAALMAGTALGCAGRLLMRVIALESGLPGSYSLGGSLEVVLFGILLGAPLAAGFCLVRPWLRWSSPLPGLTLGLLLTALLAAFPPTSARSALAATPDTPIFTLVGFGLLFTAWGVALELLTGTIWRRPGLGREEMAARRNPAQEPEDQT
jgi:hypothetical protein